MKNLIITAIVFIATASVGFAQVGSAVTETFNTHARVLSTLSVTNSSDLDFDNVIQGANKTVAGNTTAGGASVSYGTGHLADFAISGTGGKEVGAYLSTTDDPTDGSNTLTVTDWTAWSNTSNTLVSANVQTNPTSWANRIDVTLDGSGNGYVWIGATAQPSGSQAAGDYNVSNTVTFYYTGN